MKAPSAGYRIVRYDTADWRIIDEIGSFVPRVVWRGKTHKGARTAHYRLSVERLTGKPVSYAQARRAGNA